MQCVHMVFAFSDRVNFVKYDRSNKDALTGKKKMGEIAFATNRFSMYFKRRFDEEEREKTILFSISANKKKTNPLFRQFTRRERELN